MAPHDMATGLSILDFCNSHHVFWQEGSLERFLQDIGVPTNQIENVVIEAVAWRVTPGGRPLIDRRRRARVERNMQMVADYLELECRVSTGKWLASHDVLTIELD